MKCCCYVRKLNEQNEGICHNKNNKVFLTGDSRLSRINIENFRKEFKGDWVYFKCIPGTKELDYYSIPMLVDEKPNINYTYRVQRHRKIELSHHQRR